MTLQSMFPSPHHIDMVQTTAFHESGENGSFENINIEREAINYGEEIIGSRFAEENSNYGYLYKLRIPKYR